MKKRLCMLLALLMSAGSFSACYQKSDSDGGDALTDLNTLGKSIAISDEYDEQTAKEYSGGSITSGGEYILSGEISSLPVVISAGSEDEVTLVLDNAVMENHDGPAIVALSAKSVRIISKEGTQNILSDGEAYEYTADGSSADAVIFAKTDLIIAGSGELSITGNYKHGAVSKDELSVSASGLSVSAQKAGLCGKDCVNLSLAVCTINAGSDGIRSDNDEDSSKGYISITDSSLSINAANDGIQAQTELYAADSDITVISGGGSGAEGVLSEESYKGLKAGSSITVSGGIISVDSADDCIHSNGSVGIAGGEFTLSSGDDGIHADGELSVSDGSIVITESYEGLEGSDITISGGYISITSSDDGINAADGSDSDANAFGRFGGDIFTRDSGSILIEDGYILINASGDGIDSNGSLEITGGTVLISGLENSANGALDYSGSASINGGTLIALGSSGMALSISSDTQGVLAVSFERQQGGNAFLVSDENGGAIASFTPQKAYDSAVVSSPDMTSDGEYTIVTGADIPDADENGYSANAAYSGGSTLEYTELSGGMGMPQRMPEGAQPPDMPEGDMPEGMQPPELPEGEMPEGMQPPELPEGEMPEGMQPPDMPEGDMPEGMQPPELPEGEMPEGAFPDRFDRNRFDKQGDMSTQ